MTIKSLSFLALSALFFYSCDNAAAEDDSTAAEITVTEERNAETLPAFMLVDEQGTRRDLSAFRGKKLFVNLWATWCPPCRAEMPSIQKLYNSTDRDRAEFIMLSLDEDFQSAKFYRSKESFSFPIYAPAQNLPELFNVRGIPATFIFDESGRLIHRRDGSDNYDTDKYRELLK